MINFRKFCEDNGVEISPAGYTCTSIGYVNIQCPFCDDTGYRFGYNESEGFGNCFRCGWHSEAHTISKLLNTTKAQTYEILNEYRVGSNAILPRTIKQHSLICELPEEADNLKKPHCDYLRSRNFNPKELQRKWGLEGTQYTGSYSERIIAPIYFKNTLVSFQGRDITGKSSLRYKACSLANEVIHHKDIVYGFDKAYPYKQCVVVEGITDVWRLGYGAVCTFGIKWTEAQMRLLSRNFEKVYIAFDNEKQAQEQAKKLQAELEFRGVDCVIINSIPEGTDPGELKQEEADRFMKELRFV